MVATVTGVTVELVATVVLAEVVVVTPAVLCLVATVSTLEFRGEDGTLSLRNAALTVAVVVTTGCICIKAGRVHISTKCTHSIHTAPI